MAKSRLFGRCAAVLCVAWLALFPVGCELETQPDSPLAGDVDEPNTESAAQPQVVQPASVGWAPAASMFTARRHHSATRLSNGNVLVAGGDDGMNPLVSVEIYDRSTGTWASAAPMSAARSSHQAVLLPDGRVLVAGGSGAGAALASAEIYDPQSGAWIGAAPMSVARVGHSATLLPLAAGDQVLVVGGSNGAALASAERYDPATNTWTPAASMQSARGDHSATLLRTGKVLVAGGAGVNALSSAERYDPFTDTWSPAGALAQARAKHGAARLRNGKLLVVGGEAGGALSSAELYDPATNLWAAAGVLAQARSGASVVALPHDRVVALGGEGAAPLAGTETYNPATGGWSPAPPMSAARSGQSATLLQNGKVLVAGGAGPSGVLASAELHDGALSLGDPCTTALQCASGFCASGFCCDSACESNGCAVCSAALGASANGTCTAVKPNGPCSFSSACWQGSTGHCSGMSCLNATVNNCNLSWVCYKGWCDAEQGCIGLDAPNGSPCTDLLYDPTCWTGNAVCENGAAILKPVPAPLGVPCVTAASCASGACVDGYCISAACSAGPCWRPAGPIALSRRGQLMSNLPNGGLIVHGGVDDLVYPVGGFLKATYFSGVSTFTPDFNFWASSDAVSGGSAYAASLVLADGSELFTGGEYWSGLSGNIQKRASASRIGMTVPPMWAARSRHTMTLLPSGEALVVGGSPVLDVERYQPAANQWLPGPSLVTPRTGHTATLLLNGKVLVVGGGTATAELYDWATETWTPAAPMSIARTSHTATLLLDGKVLVTGGTANTSAERYDPATNTWAPAAPMSSPRTNHSALRMSNGEVVVVGPGTTVERYDPTNNTWTSLPPMMTAHVGPSLAELSGGRLLVAFGTSSATLAWSSLNSEIFGLAAPAGTPCVKPSSCQSGFCVDGVCCNSACAGGSCDACSVAAGAAVDGVCALLSGQACNDGSVCTANDTCQNGVCTGTSVVSCAAADDCHDPGVCDPATGVCSAPVKADGTPCNNGNACTTVDTCENGLCVGKVPVVCAAPDACHNAGVCNVQTGLCDYPIKPNDTPCNDGSACTVGDACQSGVCTGSSVVSCPALNDCHDPGVCDPATGVCSTLVKPDGTPCNDGNACTTMDTCESGLCVGKVPAVCAAPDACHNAGVCNTLTGCVYPVKPDSTPCNDGNACTSADSCQSGTCLGTPLPPCAAVDACHDAGSCDPATGLCSTPAKADGSACDDQNPCTTSDTCQGGSCVGASPLSCAAPDACHEAGSCDPQTGLCANPLKADGTPCPGGACLGGVCVIPDAGGAGGSGGGGAGGATGTGSSSSSGGVTTSGGPPGNAAPATPSSCSLHEGSPGSARWLSLVLLALLRRRRSAARSRLIVPHSPILHLGCDHDQRKDEWMNDE